jgi:hypothetical protein
MLEDRGAIDGVGVSRLLPVLVEQRLDDALRRPTVVLIFDWVAPSVAQGVLRAQALPELLGGRQQQNLEVVLQAVDAEVAVGLIGQADPLGTRGEPAEEETLELGERPMGVGVPS